MARPNPISIPQNGAAIPAPAANPLRVRSVEKAFRMLDAFSRAHPVMGLTQLANTLGVDKSEAQRFAFTLTELGYLRKDPLTKALQLTVKTLDLGHNYLSSNPIVRAASTYLTHLNTLTDETVNLSILDGTDIVYVQRIVSRHVFNSNVVIGTRLPAFCTAAGIAMLSRLEPGEARGILERSELVPHTPTTTWHIPELTAKLEQTARQGYSVIDREYFNDICIGAAICDPRGQPLAAISVALSPARMSLDEAVAKHAPLVVEAARSIPV